MSAINVRPTEPTLGTLIAAAYPAPDYRDAFLVNSGCNDRIEDFATNFFLRQPRWIAKVSMNLGGGTSRLEAIGAGGYPDCSSVGSWKVHGRSENEIMFGDHMGFMEYRFSVLQRTDGCIEAVTVVKYLKRFGHIYFAIVKPFHRAFIKIALRNAADATANLATS
jgi:hypothetical protein